MTILLIATVVTALMFWVFMAAFVNCGEPFVDTLIELALVGAACVAFAAFAGCFVGLITFVTLTVVLGHGKVAR